MEHEPRKATDILLTLESKVEVLLNTVQTLDFNIKVLSNKLNEIMKSLDKQQQVGPRITVEAVQQPSNPMFAPSMPVDPERAIPVTAFSKLPQSDEPHGFRRTSRPESYSKEAQASQPPLPPQQTVVPQFPMQVPKPPPGRSVGDVVGTPTAPTPKPKNKVSPADASPQMVTEAPPSNVEIHNVVPVEQRVLDRNGKSVFLADVEIVNMLNGEQVLKTRTSGMGKWNAALAIGTYQVTIRKHETVTKTNVESVQTIKIDGTQSPLKLQTVIIK